MTQAPPPPLPPAPPPPSPPSRRPSWLPLAIGAGAVAAVGIALVVGGVFSGEPQSGTSTVTTDGGTSTSVTTTTTVPGTGGTTVTTAPTSTTSTTGAPTTTIVAAGWVDEFAGATSAVPSFGPDFMTFSITEQQRIRLRSVQTTAFVLPMLYPEVVGDAGITFSMRPELKAAGAGAGAIVYADAAVAPTGYVLVEVVEDAARVDIIRYAGGVFTTEATGPIPVGAAFAPDGFNTIGIVLAGGSVSCSINGVEVVQWAGPAGPGTGYVGFHLSSRGADDAVVIDDWTVTIP